MDNHPDPSPLDLIQQLEILTGRLLDAEHGPARARLFGDADRMLGQLDTEARTYPGMGYILEKIDSVRHHLRALAGLADDDGHARQQHAPLALQALDSLDSNLGFDRDRGSSPFED